MDQTGRDSVAAIKAQFPLSDLSNRAPAGYVAPTGGTEARDGGRPFDCSPLATPEGEPDCADLYVDAYNGGCNSTPAVFRPITCGAVIRGKSGTYLDDAGNGNRDMDWYQVTVTEPTLLTWSALAEFPVNVWLLSGDCTALVTLAFGTAPPCSTATAEACVGAGTYTLIIAPNTFSGIPCGADAEYCATLTCAPCTLPPPLACPADAFVNLWQLPFGEDEAWAAYPSNSQWPPYDPEPKGVKIYEHFAGVAGPGGIDDVHWWGVGYTINDSGDISECPLEPGNFHIGFLAHDPLTNRPDWALGELYGFNVTGAALTKTDTGHVFKSLNGNGSVAWALTLYSWDCNLPVPWYPQTEGYGWLTIQNTDNCAFGWAGSSGPVFGGGGIHVVEDEGVTPPTHTDIDGDVSFCLTTDQIGPFTGACCAWDAGVCRQTTNDECVGTYDAFSIGITCAAWPGCNPAEAEAWACCESGSCSLQLQADCAGTWYRFYVCATTDPGYDPDAFGGVGNLKICPAIPPFCPITCDSPAAFSRGLAGGYLYLSWDRGEGDRRFVIDFFTGFTGSIRKMKWWGNSTQIWDGPDCDFAQPAPFAVRFYHTSGTGPNYLAPYREFDPIYATWSDTGYGWTSSPEFGAIDCYIANIPTPFAPGTGTQWVGIASKTADPCDYIWAPGADGTSGGGQWFYDDTSGTPVCEAEPGRRHRSFCLHTNINTGACCNELTGVCTNWQQEGACLTAGGTFYKSLRCNQIPAPGCVAIPGACCDHTTDTCTITLASACTAPGQVWLGKGSTCDECCVALCPPGSTLENEPVCGDDYVDTYNIGCFSDVEGGSPDLVLQIADGEKICGQSGVFNVTGGRARDFDFYRYELTDASALVQAKVEAEFPVNVWLTVGSCFSEPCEGNWWNYVQTYSLVGAAPCDIASAAAAIEGPDFVYVIVTTAGTDIAVPCGASPYTLWIEKAPAGCCVIGEDEGLTSQQYCLALGGTWTPGPCGVVETGACCDYLACTITLPADCAGDWQGAGTTCTPNPCTCGRKGDANCDGSVNTFDIDPFVLALTQPTTWDATYSCDMLCATDCNDDGSVNTFDIDPFVICLTSGCE